MAQENSNENKMVDFKMADEEPDFKMVENKDGEIERITASGARHWVFTVNGEKKALEDLWECWRDPINYQDQVEYLVVGKEVGEEGTFHLQGYLTLKKKQRLGWLKRNVSAHAHWEVRRGTHEQARDYITNNKDKPNPCYFKWGVEPPGPGSDWDMAIWVD